MASLLHSSAGTFLHVNLVQCLICGISPLLAQEVGEENILRENAPPGGTFEEAIAIGADAGFAAWVDSRNDDLTDQDIYAQKVTAEGAVAWTANGLLLCDAPRQQLEPTVSPDGTGGAVIAWRDLRETPRGIHAQRVSANGSIQWSANGQLVGGTAWVTQSTPNLHLAPDGNFLLTYGEDRATFLDLEYWLVAQKISGAGQRLWGENGISVIQGVRMMRSVPDGSGGLLVLGRIRGSEPTGFRLQRVLANQTIAWASPIDISATLPSLPRFGYAPDGEGGLIVAFIESNAVRGVRVAGNGSLPWGAAGVTIADSNVTIAEAPKVVPDGSGGAFISWIVSSPRDIHVQHVAADGLFLWPEEGAIVEYAAGGAERDMHMIADGEGGLYVTWETSRGVHVHRVDSSGMVRWATNGLRFSTGFDPRIGVGPVGPLVIYRNFTGLSARVIQLPGAVRLRIIEPNWQLNQISFRLDGGSEGISYNVLRRTDVAASEWEQVGTVKPGEEWTDASAPLPNAFYTAREPLSN